MLRRVKLYHVLDLRVERTLKTICENLRRTPRSRHGTIEGTIVLISRRSFRIIYLHAFDATSGQALFAATALQT